MGSGNVSPSVYLPLLQAGYAGVKAGDPSALALLGAPSPTGANIPGESIDDLQYLQQLFALNGGVGKNTSMRFRRTRAAFRIRPTARRRHPNAACPAASTTTRASLLSIASDSTAI